MPGRGNAGEDQLRFALGVVYLTGAAASGKSALTRNLRALCPELVVFSYSDRLRDLIANRQGALHGDEAMRKSAGIATPSDIETLDNSLLNLVTYERADRSILIDSPAVMKDEAYLGSGRNVARDEGLHHFINAVGLRSGLAGPLVLAVLE